MDLVSRVRGILFKPNEEWAKIKAEDLTITQLFLNYALILAAIPAVAQFLGRLLQRRVPGLRPAHGLQPGPERDEPLPERGVR